MALDRLVRVALELFFPARCAGCDELLDEESAIFCASCALSIEPIGSACPRCARVLPAIDPRIRPPPCLECLMRPPRFEAAFAPYQFGGALAQAVRRLKWSSRPELARPLGMLLADGVARAGPAFADVELVVPVPLHPRRLRAREFNQAALLAAVMTATLDARGDRDWRVDAAALARVRDTPPQTGLGRAQRRSNVYRAFTVPRWARARVRGKRILVVDDVLTTGATADACASALFDGGAAAVLVLTLGRAMT